MVKKTEAKVKGEMTITKVTEAVGGAYRIEGDIFAEGMTVGKDKWYTKQAVQKAADEKTFDGVPMFLNHATEQEEWQRPERDIRDMVAKVVKTWYADESGKARLKFEALIHGSPTLPAEQIRTWFKNLMAAGVTPETSQHSWIEGNQSEVEGYPVFVVERIAKAESVDFVTFGNAGGVINAAEAVKKAAEAADIKKTEGGHEDMTIKEILEALSKDAELKKAIVEALKAETSQAEELKKAQEAKESVVKEKEALEAKLAEIEVKEHRKAILDEAKAKVKESKLPAPAESRVLESVEALSIGKESKKEDVIASVDTIIAKEKKYLDEISKPGVFGNGSEEVNESGEMELKESIEAANKLLEKKTKEAK